MFGNRGYVWKLGGAVALIALLGVYAGNRGDTINPSVWRCLAEPRRWEGTRIWVPGARVVTVRDRDYDIVTGTELIRVAGPAPAAAGSWLSLVAVFHGDGPMLVPLQTRPIPAQNHLRRVMEAVSILVTLAVLVNFGRHFLFRPKILQVEGDAG